MSVKTPKFNNPTKKGLGDDESELEDIIGVYRCFDARDAKFCERGCRREPKALLNSTLDMGQIGSAIGTRSSVSWKID